MSMKNQYKQLLNVIEDLQKISFKKMNQLKST